MIRKTLAATAIAAVLTAPAMAETQLYWGDTHLHTRYSFDAFLNGNHTADPDTAYRFAKGQPVMHPYHRAWVRLDRPLDFLVVSDHAEFMGVMPSIYFEEEPLPDLGLWGNLKRWFVIKGMNYAIWKGGKTAVAVFRGLLPKAGSGEGDPVAQKTNDAPATGIMGDMSPVEEAVWTKITNAADQHNEPGKFTAFIGWEWSSVPSGANLHRVVMSPTDSATAQQFSPYGSDQSQYPEDLWAWIGETSAATGAEFMAIPHNSNISKGYMFAETTLRGEKMTPAYAKLRAEIEPMVEVTQIKGDSETWPSLSPNDPFADYEAFQRYIEQDATPYEGKKGDFIRAALKTGLEIENDIGVNPFKFGLIGSTDAHTGLASADSTNFHGKMARDSVPENKYNKDFPGVNGWIMSASGYAAVWAEDNTRDSIFAAFKRRETYATTGPRITLRMFGGYDFEADAAQAEDIAAIGYETGVPMGGDLIANEDGDAVQLLIRAVKDPIGANLDRVQVVKGWLDANGDAQEKVYNVAWDDARAVNADGSLAPIGNSVDITTGRYENNIGAAELATVWTDPDFDAAQKAFYYVRVLEIPTPRHSLYDTLALGQEHGPEAGPATIQERAYSSPIWYTPN